MVKLWHGGKSAKACFKQRPELTINFKTTVKVYLGKAWLVLSKVFSLYIKNVKFTTEVWYTTQSWHVQVYVKYKTLLVCGIYCQLTF